MLRLLLLLCLLPAAGRAQSSGAGSPRRVLLEVPFFPSSADQCGPTALASLLRFWGSDIEPAVLKREIYRPELKGSLNVDLLLAAQARGLSAELLEGGLEGIKGQLDAGRPVIAFLNVGLKLYPVGHYLVVTGYDEERRGFYAHTGEDEDSFVPYRRFLKQWDRTQQWALQLAPRAP